MVGAVTADRRIGVTFVRQDPAGLGSGPAEVALSNLIEALGQGLLDVVVAPQGLDLTVTDPVIFDPTVGQPIHEGELILGVGLTCDSEAARDLVVAAGRDHAGAVVLRGGEAATDEIRATAEAAGVALLLIPPTTGWEHVFTLIRTALEASRADTWSSQAGLAIGDLVSLANAVAGTVGGAATIEDPDSVVLAFSSLGHPIDIPRQDTILGHRVPSSWREVLRERGVFKQLYETDDVVHVTDLGEPDVYLAPRMAIAVRAGGELLGSIWVAEADRPFDDQAVQALRAAGRIAALHMLHHRSAGDIERQRQRELIRTLLDGMDEPVPGMSSLGLTGIPVAVLAVDPDLTQIAADEAEVRMERAVSVITLYAEVYRRRARVVAVDGIIYVLLPCPDGTQPSSLLTFADNVVQRAQVTTRTVVRVGIGSPAAELRDVQRSRREADEVLRVLHRSSKSGLTAHVDDVRGQLALLHLEDLAAHDPRLRAGKIRTLVEHDRRRQTSYVDTLRAYLDEFGDVPAAAARLSIHRNTFRYRLGRLIELSGLDLSDADERLITHLQLRLLDDHDAAGSDPSE
jgi:PucR-like helix-turn-helix protein/diguanylate cyclase with GGDEF domain